MSRHAGVRKRATGGTPGEIKMVSTKVNTASELLQASAGGRWLTGRLLQLRSAGSLGECLSE